jgi:hypothetical protein
MRPGKEGLTPPSSLPRQNPIIRSPPHSTLVSMHTPLHGSTQCLLLGNLDGSIVDTLDDVVGVLAVDGATNRLGRAEDLLDGTGERLGERLWT